MSAAPRPRFRRALLVALSGATALGLLGVVPAAPSALVAPVGAVPAPGQDPDPGDLGPETVTELEYDLGDEAYRPPGFPAAVEIKAKVYAPETITGRAPIVILQHGRHATCGDEEEATLEWPCRSFPEIPSYQGYDDLGRLLASHGMIVASVGANGINAVDGFVADAGANARGLLVLEHLRLWEQWDTTATGPFGTRFNGHVDLDAVGLMGHSRGGEGVVAGAQINQRLGSPYGIRAVSALAPVDFARRLLGGVPLQVVLPFCDGDVSDLQGTSYYDDGRVGTPGDQAAKQTTLLHGANHNFFNTVWTQGPGSFDDAEWGFFGEPSSSDGCAPGGVGRLTGPQQSAAGATIMGGFLRRFVADDPAFQPFVTGVTAYPASSGPARWSVAYHGGPRLEVARWATGDDARLNVQGRPSRILSASPELVCGDASFDFGDPTRFPCPGFAQMANTTGVLDVGWVTRAAVARGELPPGGSDVTGYDGVRFRIGFPTDGRNDRRGRQDMSVRLVDADGATSSVAVGTFSSAFARRPVSAVEHTVLNGVRVPLSAFSGVDLTRITAVELRFDRTDSGRAIVSDLAFSQEGTGERIGAAAGAATTAPILDRCRVGASRQWACAVAAVAWGRPAIGSELSSLASAYGTSSAGSRVTAAVEGPTAGRLAVGHRAQIMYGDADSSFRVSEALGRARGSWDGALLSLSSELWGATGATASPGGAVDSIYLALVGRLPDSAGRAYWAGRVPVEGTARLARTLLSSAERASQVLAERFAQIVGRAPDAAAAAYWTPRLRADRGEQMLVAALLRSAEFRTVALR